MSLTGTLLDVSVSMQDNTGSGVDEEDGPWAQSIFKVIDNLIEHDLTSENRVFAIGVGASCTKDIFDIIRTLQQIKNMEMPSYKKNTPATINHINEILDILEGNGARNIRKWVKDPILIQYLVSDYMAALVLKKLKSDEGFLKKFVHEFLPVQCRNKADIRVLSWAEDWFVRGVTHYYRSATGEDIYEIIDKAKCYFLKTVEVGSVFSVQDASRIIRGYVDENELTIERGKELLENVEPFIYGRTPLYVSLEKAAEFFERDNSKDKLLFVLSDGDPTDGDPTDGDPTDGDPTDGSDEDNAKIKQIISKLSRAGVKVVSCFVTRSTNIKPKRLYDKSQPGWESGAKFLFSLSSHVPTQHLPRAILAKRGWTIDISNNETRLFVQVNRPENLR